MVVGVRGSQNPQVQTFFDIPLRLVWVGRDLCLTGLLFFSCGSARLDPCPTLVSLPTGDLGTSIVSQLDRLIAQTLENPTAAQLHQARTQDGVLAYRFDGSGFGPVDLDCPPGGCSSGSGHSFGEPGGGGGGNWGRGADCSQDVEKGLSPEGFKHTTYYGKVASTLGVRILSAPSRAMTNPSSFLGDLVMVFVSPRIKQSLRNKRLFEGKGFGVHTVITLFPYRVALNLSVSSLDALLAYGTARLDNPTLSNQDVETYAFNRLKSNVLSYVVLDSITSGLDDHLVLDKLVPLLVARICAWVPNSRWAVRTAQAGIVLAYSGMSSGWELIHYGLIRGILFKSRDAKPAAQTDSRLLAD